MILWIATGPAWVRPRPWWAELPPTSKTSPTRPTSLNIRTPTTSRDRSSAQLWRRLALAQATWRSPSRTKLTRTTRHGWTSTLRSLTRPPTRAARGTLESRSLGSTLRRWTSTIWAQMDWLRGDFPTLCTHPTSTSIFSQWRQPGWVPCWMRWRCLSFWCRRRQQQAMEKVGQCLGRFLGTIGSESWVFPSAAGYMLWSLGFLHLIWGIFHRFLQNDQ